MKTRFTLILVVCTLLVGCKSATKSLTQEEEKLVGKYYYSETKDLEQIETDLSAAFLMEDQIEYGADRTCTSKGTAKLVLASKNMEEAILNVEYQFSTESTWQVEDGKLLEVVNPESFRFEFSKSNAESEKAKKVVAVFENSSELVSSLLKDAIMKSQDAKIIELTDTKLVLEQNGEQCTLTKVK